MSPENTVTMTHEQFELAKEVAVHEKQLEILIEDYKKSRDSLNASIGELSHNIDLIPKMISDCKDELEEDIMTAASDKYVTHDEIRSTKNKIIGAVFMTGIFLGSLDVAFKLGWIN